MAPTGDADVSREQSAGHAASSSDTGGTAGPAAGSAARSPDGVAGTAPDDGAPTWSGIYTHVFTTCRLASCHGGGTAQLNMATRDAGYVSLVNQPPRAGGQCASFDKQRVVPYEPDNSLLYRKLDQTAPCGQQMPPGGQLSQSARDRIRAWIMLGAKDD
jgi:hypothetical protein